jgi:hypothetical protein
MRVITDNCQENKSEMVCPRCNSELEVNWRTDWQKARYCDMSGASIDCPVCERSMPIPLMNIPTRFRFMIVDEDY